MKKSAKRRKELRRLEKSKKIAKKAEKKSIKQV